MSTATIRIPEDKRDTLKVIASIERREMKEIISELIEQYIKKHRQTLETLQKPEWVELIRKGKKEVTKPTMVREEKARLKLAESSFSEWDNAEDEVYDNL